MSQSYPVNVTKRKLRQGKPVFGIAMSDFSGISLPHVLAQLGFESLFFDMEHSPDDFGSVCDLIWSARRSGITPMVRVQDPERFFLSRALDAGAQGVIVPRVETVEQVDRIVSFCRYPPLGTRGVALGGRHMDYASSQDWNETMKAANNEVLVAVMIETAAGLHALDSIASRPGIDMLFIGPADLSAAVGTPGHFRSPQVDDAIARIVDAARRNNLLVGVQGGTPEMCIHCMGLGVRHLFLGNVMGLVRQAGQRAVAEVRQAAEALEKGVAP